MTVTVTVTVTVTMGRGRSRSRNLSGAEAGAGNFKNGWLRQPCVESGFPPRQNDMDQIGSAAVLLFTLYTVVEGV